MTLALTVDPGSATAANRLTVAAGGLMVAVLLLAAWEQWQEGASWRQCLLSLSAAFACAGWCCMLVWRELGSDRSGRHGGRSRRNRGRPRWLLQIAPDGRLRLADPATDVAVDAAVMMAWSLGNLIYLRVGPISKVVADQTAADAGQSAASACAGHADDSRWLLAKRDLSPADWHGLRRWLVWYRRSGQGGAGRPDAVRAF